MTPALAAAGQVDQWPMAGLEWETIDKTRQGNGNALQFHASDPVPGPYLGAKSMRYLLYAALLGGSLLMNFMASSCTAEKKKPDLAEERHEAFARMAKLGYPETRGLKFVLVATGNWSQHDNDPPENRFQYGFLMEDKGNAFKVLSLDLEVQAFQKTPPKTPAHQKVGYEVLDLNKEALALLAELKAGEKPGKKPRRRMGIVFGPDVSKRTVVFLLAWACAQRGLDGTAARLYEQARSQKYNRYGEGREKPVKTLQEKVADELALVEMWRGELVFGDPRTPRPVLLRRFERIAKHFPKSEHLARATETAALLKRMIKEDEEHAALRKKGKPFHQLSKKDRIAELIFQLRDQPGGQVSQPDSGDIFRTFSGKADTPAHRLVAMGYDAVPQLVEVIGDRRFSRAVGGHPSQEVLRVGECAQMIVETIAGLSFDKPRFAKGGKGLKGPELARAEIRAWYAELTRKGEKGFLTEATERGDEISGQMATRLAKKYRNEALPVLMRGARAAKLGRVRATMVELIASFKGEKSLQFLLAEVREGPFAQGRLTAAGELHKLGRPEGLAAMIGWWRGGLDARKDKKDRDEDPADWSFSIAEFLAHCGSVEAIHTLAKGLHKRPIRLRMEVISTLGDEGNLYREKIRAKEPAKVAAAVEALLVAALDDTEEDVGVSGSQDSKEFADPRVCDMAGHVLNQLHPKKYAFDLAGQLGARDRQRVAL
jgi:hypothetical protein